MDIPYVGQIIITAFGYTPKGYAQCNGQLLPIHTNQALYHYLGTRYGGDGRITFALPDLRGATPVGSGASADPAWTPVPYALGDSAGAESVVLQAEHIPTHAHKKQLAVAAPGSLRSPSGALLAKSNGGAEAELLYAAPSASTTVELAKNTVSNAGGAAHPNMQPFQVVSFCIALTGIYPAPQ
jgi:microcystin-dependent protein